MRLGVSDQDDIAVYGLRSRSMNSKYYNIRTVKELNFLRLPDGNNPYYLPWEGLKLWFSSFKISYCYIDSSTLVKYLHVLVYNGVPGTGPQCGSVYSVDVFIISLCEDILYSVCFLGWTLFQWHEVSLLV